MLSCTHLCTTIHYTPLVELHVTWRVFYFNFLIVKCFNSITASSSNANIYVYVWILLSQDHQGNLLRSPRSVHRIRPRGPSRLLLELMDKPTMPSISTPNIRYPTACNLSCRRTALALISSIQINIQQDTITVFWKISRNTSEYCHFTKTNCK